MNQASALLVDVTCESGVRVVGLLGLADLGLGIEGKWPSLPSDVAGHLMPHLLLLLNGDGMAAIMKVVLISFMKTLEWGRLTVLNCLELWFRVGLDHTALFIPV